MTMGKLRELSLATRASEAVSLRAGIQGEILGQLGCRTIKFQANIYNT